jgi:hypothetical protein
MLKSAPPRLDGRLHLAQHVEGGLFALARVTEITEVVGRRRQRHGFGAAHGLDHVVGAELGRHVERRVDRDVGDVEIAGRRREHHGHHPRVARDASHPPHVAHVEQAAEVLPEALGHASPDVFASHRLNVASRHSFQASSVGS